MAAVIGITINDHLVHCEPTGEAEHTGKYMAQLVDEHGARFEKDFGCLIAGVDRACFNAELIPSGVVTDNASNMVALRTELEKRRPGLFTYACQAHTLSLVVLDLFKLQGRMTVMNNTVTVLTRFKNSHLLSADRT